MEQNAPNMGTQKKANGTGRKNAAPRKATNTGRKNASAAGTSNVGETMPTDETGLVTKGYSLFEEFRSAYQAEWERLNNCEKYYQGRHWDDVPMLNPKDPRPVTPVLQSTIENVKADLMDYYPEAIIRPETPEDRTVAEILAAVIRQNHDAASYRQEYMKLAHDLLTSGYMVQEVGYDVNANYGIGSAFIRYVDVHNILFDPQCVDIQDGRAVFKIAPKTMDWLNQRYPDKAGKFAADEYTLESDSEVQYDATKSVLLLEFWWREYNAEQERFVVHMAQMAGRQLLSDSRIEKPEGYFAVGEYPFVITPLFRRKTSCLGYGLVEMFAPSQAYSDKLDQITLKNAAMSSQPHMLVQESSGFDADDLRDWSKTVHKGESINGVQWLAQPPLPQYVIQYAAAMREGVKDESGSNDFSRGNTASGVTAASAIAALQEASSKRSRMITGQMHEAFKRAVRYEIEFEREYNMLPREVLVTINGQQQTVTFESAIMERESALGNTVPVEFMISIKVQRENVWTVTAHNELIIQMVQMQIVSPQQAAELMIYEGKEELLSKMATQGGTVSPEQQAMEQQAMEQQALEAQMQELPPPEAVTGQIGAARSDKGVSDLTA